MSVIHGYSFKHDIGIDLILRYLSKDDKELYVLCSKFSVMDPESSVN